MPGPVVSPPLVKTSSESILYGFDFTRLMTTGETISAVSSVTATTPDGASALTVGAGAVTDDALASARISGGTAGYRYRVTCRVTTSAGNTRDCIGDLDVSDG